MLNFRSISHCPTTAKSNPQQKTRFPRAFFLGTKEKRRTKLRERKSKPGTQVAGGVEIGDVDDEAVTLVVDHGLDLVHVYLHQPIFVPKIKKNMKKKIERDNRKMKKDIHHLRGIP